jgi:hypothetical protein
VLQTPDGLHWLTAGNDSRVRLWDARRNRRAPQPPPPQAGRARSRGAPRLVRQRRGGTASAARQGRAGMAVSGERRGEGRFCSCELGLGYGEHRGRSGAAEAAARVRRNLLVNYADTFNRARKVGGPAQGPSLGSPGVEAAGVLLVPCAMLLPMLLHARAGHVWIPCIRRTAPLTKQERERACCAARAGRVARARAPSAPAPRRRGSWR